MAGSSCSYITPHSKLWECLELSLMSLPCELLLLPLPLPGSSVASCRQGMEYVDVPGLEFSDGADGRLVSGVGCCWLPMPGCCPCNTNTNHRQHLRKTAM